MQSTQRSNSDQPSDAFACQKIDGVLELEMRLGLYPDFQSVLLRTFLDRKNPFYTMNYVHSLLFVWIANN